MAETIYNVQVTYKGVPDPERDGFVEQAAEESGGNWLGQGYDPRKDLRDHSWDFQTKRDANSFVKKIRTVRGFRTTAPKRLKEKDFRPEIKTPVPTRRRRRG